MAITGLILAGGRGIRMGSVDKGLQMLRGVPLVQHVVDRLAPQVDALLINANRNLTHYQRFKLPLCPDIDDEFAGPLAGVQAGLRCCQTPLMVTVPCDSPFLPLDLVQRLHDALLREQADLAIAVSESDGVQQAHPVFCLLKATLLPSLDAYLENGGRKMLDWQKSHKLARVLFTDAAAFYNINTLQELHSFEAE